MAGFLGLFDYTKEGPGVRKDEPDKGPVRGTFEILFRRFWELIRLNLMLLLFNLPALVVAFLAATFLLSAVFPGLSIETMTQILASHGISAIQGQQLETAAVSQLAIFYLVTAFTLVGTLTVVVGPFQAGFAYILRNFIRDEHVFLWSDFWEQTKANWRQSLLGCLYSLAALIILTVNFSFYETQTALPQGFRFVLQILLIMIGLVWLMAQQYLYPMLVTFRLSLPQIYRNSFLFVFLRLPYNIVYMLLAALILVAVPLAFLYFFSGTGLLLLIFWYLFLAPVLTEFFSMAIVWRGIDRHMIQNRPPKAEAAEDRQEPENSRPDEGEPEQER